MLRQKAFVQWNQTDPLVVTYIIGAITAEKLDYLPLLLPSLFALFATPLLHPLFFCTPSTPLKSTNFPCVAQNWHFCPSHKNWGRSSRTKTCASEKQYYCVHISIPISPISESYCHMLKVPIADIVKCEYFASWKVQGKVPENSDLPCCIAHLFWISDGKAKQRSKRCMISLKYYLKLTFYERFYKTN